MKLLILGGGTCQLNAVRRAKELGITVGVADYHWESPGKREADFSVMASTFDVKACMKAASDYEVDGIMTLGTDQPVLTCALVAKELGLPSLLTPEQATGVTDKKVMKEIFVNQGIPTSPYKILGKDFKEEELSPLKAPYVIKPLDSQGQRGVYLLHHSEEIRRDMEEVLGFSRKEEFLVEEYYPSEEITVSGWVEDGRTEILTITDRGTFRRGKHIGICSNHQFPSKHLPTYYEDIVNCTHQLTKAFQINQGPIYYQLLIGREGIRVNEVAARIGGAYEDIFIPEVTGFSILDQLIMKSLGKEGNQTVKALYPPNNNPRVVSVHMIFLRKGIIQERTPLEEILSLKGVLGAGYNMEVGYETKDIENATERAAYVIIKGENKEDHEKNVRQVFSVLKILDQNHQNMMITFGEGSFK